MKNSILSTLLVLLAALSVSGCSLFSSDSEDGETATVSESESESGEVADEGSIEGAEDGDEEYAYDDFEEGGEEPSEEGGSGVVTEETLNVAATDVEVEESFSNEADVDEYPDDDYESGNAVADVSEDVYQEDSVFVDEGGDIPSDTMTSNQEQDLFVRDDQGPVVDEPVFADATDYTEPVIGSPKWIPVKKIKGAAYQKAGVNVNRVYIVRSGDTMDSVASKTSSNKQDLYNINPHFNNKSLKVGDKVYYGSSRQPNDSSMKTYHEDMNIPPQYYTSQSGDNIRKVSKKLLGHNRSWMEVWATNSEVESKDIIMGGLQLRYWPDGVDTQMAEKAEPVLKPVAEEVVEEVVEAPVVEEVAAAPAPVEESMPEPQDVAQVEEPNPFEEEEIGEISNDEEFNPPPAAGSIGGNSPPPTAVAPPPPPPPPAPVAKKMQPSNPDGPMSVSGAQDMLSAAKDDQMIMGALGGLLILAAIIMLIFIRRSRSKRVNFSQTQV